MLLVVKDMIKGVGIIEVELIGAGDIDEGYLDKEEDSNEEENLDEGW